MFLVYLKSQSKVTTLFHVFLVDKPVLFYTYDHFDGHSPRFPSDIFGHMCFH